MFYAVFSVINSTIAVSFYFFNQHAGLTKIKFRKREKNRAYNQLHVYRLKCRMKQFESSQRI